MNNLNSNSNFIIIDNVLDEYVWHECQSNCGKWSTENDCSICNHGYHLVTNVEGDSCEAWSSDESYFLDWSSCSLDDNEDLQWDGCKSPLVFDSNECKSAWSRGKYVSIELKDDLGIYENRECNECTDWYECISMTGWISCKTGYYLTLDNPGGIKGTCTQKKMTSGTLNLFVKPEFEETLNTGSYESPFGNIVKALTYANDKASEHSDYTINIYLLGGGNHYMTRNINHYHYNYEHKDQFSGLQNILIQPAFCGQNLGGHLFSAEDNDCIEKKRKLLCIIRWEINFSF
jgi:hypothetical protein